MRLQSYSQLLFFLLLPLLTVAKLTMPLRSRMGAISPLEGQLEVQHLISNNTAATPATLAPLWSVLPPIRVETAIGTYKGGLFNGPNGTKSPINWWGKQINGETSVNPLLSVSPNDTQIVFPYPRENIAQARNIEHEGIVSVTIVYNKIPLMDYFRVVKEDPINGELWLLGKSDLRGKAADPPYFWLKRTEGIKIDMAYKNPYPNTVGW
jgi:hypothetical protein